MTHEMVTRLSGALLETDHRWKPTSDVSKERSLALAALEALQTPSADMIEAMRKSVPGHISAEDAASVFSTGITFLMNQVAGSINQEH